MATVTGTAGPDGLPGSEGSDTLLGLGGDDTLLAGAGIDSLDGGAGTDRAVIDRSAATSAIRFYLLAPGLVSQIDGTQVTGVEQLWFTAGSGDDGLVGGAGDDSLAGGAGTDALQGGAGADSLLGGEGADTLLGGAGGDWLAGGAGADRFILQGSGAIGSSLAAPDRIADFNAAEGDLLVLRGEAVGTGLLPLATGSFGLSGQAALPVGFGGALAARAAPLAGMALPDATGGEGLTLYWQSGFGAGGWLLLDLDRDGILGAADLVLRLDLPAGIAIGATDFLPGTFSLLGTAGADSLAGSAAADSILGFAGADRLAGLDGDDTLAGGAGNDSLLGGAGFDSLLGGEGEDALDGGAGTDVLDGGAGDDSLTGAEGDDLLLGGAGADALGGGVGDDSLQGGFGADTLEGGAGADTLLLQGMGEAAWSSLAGMDLVTGFSRAEGDRLRISNAWFGRSDGSGADAGTYTGADGIARALVFSGSTGRVIAAPLAGMALPTQALDAYQLYWLPGAGGGWMVLDLDRNGRLDATDLVVQFDGIAGLAPADFVDGTFLSLSGGSVIAGTAGDDSLQGGSLAETFLGSAGRDRIAGGAGAGNALSYDGLVGPVAVTIAGTAAGSTAKPGGGVDSFTGIQLIAGTAGADTLDASGASAGFFALSLEGRAGNDLLIGNGTTAVQAAYATSPGPIAIDLQAGSGQDGWGSTDTLVNIRRVAALSAYGDTVMGSAGDDLFLSGRDGNKSFDGRAGQDEWRYAGDGAVTVVLTTRVSGGFTIGPYALKPGGTDRLAGIEIVAGGPGNDSIGGSAADERLGGAAGNDTLDGGGGFDTVAYENGGLAATGVVVDLTAGIGHDQWGGTDVLRNIESAWGTPLGDDLTGYSVGGAYTWLRGLAGNDTLRAPTLGTLIGADYAGDPSGIAADLAAGTVRDGWGGIDTLVNIALLRGSAFDDSLAGNGACILIGGPGNDSYRIGPGDAVIEAAGEGSDTIIAAQAWGLPVNIEGLVLTDAAGDANGWGNELDNILLGNAGANAMDGGAGQDTLRGGDGADTLYGSAGDDLLQGEVGIDALVGGPGADTLQGGAGDDLLYAEADTRFTGTLLLDVGKAMPWRIALAWIGVSADGVDGGPGYDRWIAPVEGLLLDLRMLPGMAIGVEEFIGSSANDVLLLAPGQAPASLHGGAGDDTLSGTGGADWAYGAEGADLLAGQVGNDILSGGDGEDTLLGGAGKDWLDGMAGPDALAGGLGDDTLVSGDWDAVLDGGEGVDLGHLDRGSATAALRLDARAGLLTDGTATTLLRGLEALSVIAGAGDDRLIGGEGADSLAGAAGADWLEGGGGANRLDGGVGDDTLVSAAWDAVLDGAAGQDLGLLDRGFSELAVVLDAAVGRLSDGTATTLLSGLERLSVTGGAGDDSLHGGDGADSLAGSGGADRLDGGAGADALDGGAGEDTLVSAGWDSLLDGGEGADLAILDRGFSGTGQLLDAPAGRLGDGTATTLLLGIERLSVLGGAGADTLLGGEGADTLAGGGGADSLDGGGGADALDGGAGDDTLVSAGWDAVLDGGAGLDLGILDRSAGTATLLLTATSLSDGSATTLLRGLERLSVTGGLGDDTLLGGDGADMLRGGAGEDRLDGGAGANLLDGGAGDDTLASAGWDAVLDGGAGFDLGLLDRSTGTASLVLTATSLSDGSATTLLRGLERVSVTGGAGADTLLGGDGADTLEGGGADWLDGRAGDNALEGGAGEDTLVSAAWGTVMDGGAGLDLGIIDRSSGIAGLVLAMGSLTDGTSTTLLRNLERLEVTAGLGADSLFGGAGADTLRGGAGADTLDGGGGADRLEGGLGDDLYRMDEAGVTIIEAPGEGGDTILASVDATLPANVEALRLVGAARNGSGNAGDNSITGTAGANLLRGLGGDDSLDGGGGADLLIGGPGDDRYLIHGGGERVMERPGGGWDTVLANIPGGGATLPENVEALVLLGTTLFGRGNAGDNSLTGSASANWLLAGAGADTLDGGGGNDTLFGGAGADLFLVGQGATLIGDFTPGADHLRLSGFANFAAVLAATTERAGSAVIDLGGGDSLTLLHVPKAALVADDVLLG
ncbi:hypothetical protein JMJ55_05440 [Belnapia sp. T6]|uniref:Ca2+-binding protein, RTX toxin-related n=1 Tax=Belnapia mucosa TaxID=2804532 RepID=A0ABS1UZ64_9PROT|nr:calcium-binding protein [Belnapia mucosa]MBL6454757.1 hypothetical protein [Belnapia mucosa]